MKYFVFDVESTGLTKADSVIQLAGFLLNEDFSILKAVNFYCNVNTIIPQDVIAIHGIDNRKLWYLSQGNYLEDYLEECEILSSPHDIVFVSYNIKFDTRLVNQSLLNSGNLPIDFGKSVRSLPHSTNGENYNLCLMNTLKDYLGIGKYCKLKLLAEQYLTDWSEQTILNVLTHLAKVHNIAITHDNKFHDAYYDAFIATLLFDKFKNLYKPSYFKSVK